MLSPAASPRVQQESKLSRDDETIDKENATRNPVCSPRLGLCERVLRPSALSAYPSRDAKQFDTPDDNQPPKRRVADVKSCERGEVLTRKRRFSDSAHGSGFSGSGDGNVEDSCKRLKKRVSRRNERSNDHGHKASTSTRVNPFAKPLKQVAQTAAPVRSYRAKAGKPRCTKAITDPPPRALVSYEDLWDGVSCAEEDAAGQWDDDGYCATYDFLYDGIWTRCVGRFVIPVEKDVKDLSLEEGLSCGSRRRRFRDLDRPVPFDVIW